MAGDWIKLEAVTPDKPEIYAVAGFLDCSHGDAFLACVRIWLWADQQSRNGHDLGVTKKAIDHIGGVTGLSEALAKVGWLKDKNGAMSIPNFDRHNGKTAKERALATKRKVTERSRLERDNGVTREEKRREEQEPPPDGGPIWKESLAVLLDGGFSEKSARAFLGMMCRDYDEAAVVEAVKASIGKANLPAYIRGVLRSQPKKGAPGVLKVAMP